MTASTEASVVCSAQPPSSQVDFNRPVVSILGLPFDAIDVAQAVQKIRAAAFAGKRCFVSTPNLNFAMAARTDAAFRGSVLRSDLNLVDGMPLVWIGRLLGLPLRERVSGADVFEALQAHVGPPVTVYLFGGPPGAAALACDAINQRGGGVFCVGADTAGFGSVESMSTDAQIDRINQSGARFVVVSLGAAKGQAWIERNATLLTAPVLWHLGAVVNFAAGTLQRAPRWMQLSGFEWLWRIRAEPSLWRRYRNDALAAFSVVLTRVLPDALNDLSQRVFGQSPPADAQLEVFRTPHGQTLCLTGNWYAESGLPALRHALAQCALNPVRLSINLSGVKSVGNAFTGLLLIAAGWFESHGGFEVVGTTPRLAAALHRKLVLHTLMGREQ